MDRRPDMDAHAAAKKRQYAKQKKRGRIIVITLLTITIVAIWAVIIDVLHYLYANGIAAPETTTAAVTEMTAESTAPVTKETTAISTDSEIVEIKKEGVFQGELILVSSLLDRKYVFPSGSDGIIPLYGNKSGSYRISSTNIALKDTTVSALNAMFDAYFAETGNCDYQITQGYRTLAEQTDIYDSYIETYGAEQGALLAAIPGYSEHHSGYAFDMNVYTSDGVSYSLATAGEENPIYSWIYGNAAKYGFILRYPDEKTSVTGITNEPWHFRYVGAGHAEYITEHGLTLEEYVALLYDYPENGKHLTFEYGGVSYEVYYKEMSPVGDTTELTVQKGVSYTVSGDNLDGFIVTLIK